MYRAVMFSPEPGTYLYGVVPSIHLSGVLGISSFVQAKQYLGPGELVRTNCNPDELARANLVRANWSGRTGIRTNWHPDELDRTNWTGRTGPDELASGRTGIRTNWPGRTGPVELASGRTGLVSSLFYDPTSGRRQTLPQSHKQAQSKGAQTS